MFDNYEKFLGYLNVKLQSFFEQQKEYICCKEGCSLCCKTGVYPISEIEFLYLKSALSELDYELRVKILDKILQLKKEKMQQGNDRNWTYICPFLVNDRCSIYEKRPIICRTFGLPYFLDEKIKVPSCLFEGLNYSQVYDYSTGQLSDVKFKELGYKQEPLAYNLSKKFLYNSKLAEVCNLNFGKDKALIDWF